MEIEEVLQEMTRKINDLHDAIAVLNDQMLEIWDRMDLIEPERSLRNELRNS